MITPGPPNWLLAGVFAAVALGVAALLRRHLRGKERWRYDTRAAWLRAVTYFAACWSIAAASGTLSTLADTPVVFADQLRSAGWLAWTALVLVVLSVGYLVIWPRGTKPHGRRVVVPDTIGFGIAWGVSEGLLFGSVWLLAVRLFRDHGATAGGLRHVAVVTVVVLVLSVFIGVWHAVYWDVHVSPEHNIIDWNPRKVALAHTPNVVLTTIYVTVWNNLWLYVGLQAAVLLASSIAMPFPTFRRPHPVDPTRPVLGPPVPLADTRMDGKVVVITGGAGGIGAVVSSELGRRGAHMVIVDLPLGRDGEPLEAVADRIRDSSGASVDAMPGDLGSTTDVRRLAEDLLARYPRIDVLINNAGVFTARRQESADGHELHLAVNHLGHFLLTELLRPQLEASGARVIAVSSDAHWQAGAVDIEELDRGGPWKGRDENASAGFAAYNQSKLFLTAAALELAGRTAGSAMTINVLTPGALVPTGIYRGFTGPVATVLRILRRVARSPEKAALGYVYLASSPEVTGVSGWYWKDLRPLEPSLRAMDPELRRHVWDWSCTAAGLDRAAAAG